MSKKEIRICVVDTVYSLWLSLTIFGIKETDYYIFSTGIPEEIREKFTHYLFPKTQVVFSKKIDRAVKLDVKSLPVNLNHAWQILKLKFHLAIKTFNKDVFVYGQGHLKYSYPLYKWPNNALVEDGLTNYGKLLNPTKFKYPRIARFFGFYIKYFKQGFGTHENIKKIYLTKENYPDSIKGKVEVIDLEKLWNEKSDLEKKEILNIFNLSDVYDKVNEDSILLLTQPLYEDGRLPLEEELDIYRQFLDKYPDLIIKTHPRDTKNYREIFGDVNVIDTPFPIELFKFMGISIKKIITIFSTAALNFKDEIEIEVYDGITSSDKVNKHIKLIKEKLKD